MITRLLFGVAALMLTSIVLVGCGQDDDPYENMPEEERPPVLPQSAPSAGFSS